MVASDWSVAWRDEGDFSLVDPVISADTMLLLREQQQVLATNRSGLFCIKYKAHTRVGKSRNLNTLSLSSLLYPLSSFTLRISSDESSFAKDFGVQPASALLEVDSSPSYADVKATLPLTADGIHVKWLSVARHETEETNTAAATRKAESPQVTATHEVLNTVDEGIIRSMHILNFASSSSEMSALNSVEFLVYGERLRVTSVVGHALQSWYAEDNDDISKLVRAIFKSSHLDSTVALHVHTEMDNNAELVELPRIECRNVLRQVGHVAVVKDANVEVHQHRTMGLSRCEPTEVSSQLRSKIDRPIILSYKYLNPKHSCILNVKEHAAIDTLDATVDRVHYKVLVTDTQMAHSLIVVMQSTKLQYLELFGIPSSASMFTLLVNSVPAKPVEGDRDSILIPLLIGFNPETANEGDSLRTSVELSYFSSHEALGHNGMLHLAPPQLTLPVSVVTIELWLPESHDYKISGDFGSKPSSRLEYPIPSAFSYATGKRVVEKDYKFSVIDDVWPEDTEGGKVETVKIVVPRIGNSYYFQRLLVIETVPLLEANYTERAATKGKSWLWRFLRVG